MPRVGRVIEWAEDLPLENQPELALLSTGKYVVLPTSASMAQVEYEVILRNIRCSAGNGQAAPRQLGIGVSTLCRKLQTYQLLPDGP
jgi:DNA-binding NtrC family response regulator